MELQPNSSEAMYILSEPVALKHFIESKFIAILTF